MTLSTMLDPVSDRALGPALGPVSDRALGPVSDRALGPVSDRAPLPTEGLQQYRETYGRLRWLGQETGHNAVDWWLGQETGYNVVLPIFATAFRNLRALFEKSPENCGRAAWTLRQMHSKVLHKVAAFRGISGFCNRKAIFPQRAMI